MPHWVHWIAQDADGAWWGYEHSPNRGDIGWYENEVGRIVRLGDGPPPEDWQLTLERVRSRAVANARGAVNAGAAPSPRCF